MNSSLLALSASDILIGVLRVIVVFSSNDAPFRVAVSIELRDGRDSAGLKRGDDRQVCRPALGCGCGTALGDDDRLIGFQLATCDHVHPLDTAAFVEGFAPLAVDRLDAPYASIDIAHGKDQLALKVRLFWPAEFVGGGNGLVWCALPQIARLNILCEKIGRHGGCSRGGSPYRFRRESGCLSGGLALDSADMGILRSLCG